MDRFLIFVDTPLKTKWPTAFQIKDFGQKNRTIVALAPP